MHLAGAEGKVAGVGDISWGPITPAIGLISFVPMTYQRFPGKADLARAEGKVPGVGEEFRVVVELGRQLLDV